MTWHDVVARRLEDGGHALLGDAREPVLAARGRARASTATCVSPSVPFLKPTGIDRPEASSRCTWLSAVRAPMATHDVRSAMCCGICVSRNSEPVGRPELVDVEQQAPREAQPLVDVIALVEVGVVDEPLPADHGARLLEVGPHHDEERVGERVGQRASAGRRTRAPAAGRGSSRARRRRRRRGSVAREDRGDRRPRVGHDVRGALAERDFLQQDRRRDQRAGRRGCEGRRSVRNMTALTLRRTQPIPCRPSTPSGPSSRSGTTRRRRGRRGRVPTG